MANVIISAFADEYSHDPMEHSSFLKERSVGYIEPRFVNGKNVADLAENEVKEYKKILDSYGIRVSALGSPIGKMNLADDFEAHIERAKRCFAAANIFDTQRIRMFSFYLRENQTRNDARGEVIEKIGTLLELAQSYGVVLCHENEAAIYGEGAHDCLDLLDAFGGKLRCVFDMGNFVLDGVSPYPDAYGMLKDYIEYFHIKDSLSAGAIVPAGCGEARIADILTAHKTYAKNDFFVSLEPHLECFGGLNKLTGKSFDNPYKFESAKAAFSHALDCLEEIIAKI